MEFQDHGLPAFGGVKQRTAARSLSSLSLLSPTFSLFFSASQIPHLSIIDVEGHWKVCSSVSDQHSQMNMDFLWDRFVLLRLVFMCVQPGSHTHAQQGPAFSFCSVSPTACCQPACFNNVCICSLPDIVEVYSGTMSSNSVC